MTAEEQGLLGSRYLAAHPPVPAGRIAANVNVDGMSIWGRTKDLTMVGLGKSSLDDYILALAAMQGRKVVPDQFPDRGYFYRSDQFNFAKMGVPAAYFGAGTDVIGKPPGWGKEQMERFEATDYHQPSDELRPEWDLSGARGGRAAPLLPRPQGGERGEDARVEAGRRVRGRAPEGPGRGQGGRRVRSEISGGTPKRTGRMLVPRPGVTKSRFPSSTTSPAA